jgi:ribosomal protein L37AE/L43A
MTEQAKTYTCQVCRVRPAVKKTMSNGGKMMWRCQTCADLKNRSGFTKGKQ